jgi:ABC-type branched-subunit amino acid transport system substrate-binding protein
MRPIFIHQGKLQESNMSGHKKVSNVFKKTGMCLLGLASLGQLAFMHSALAQDTIKVGVLHSLSGTMAISETTLKDTVLMLIDEQNKNGGVLGKQWW